MAKEIWKPITDWPEYAVSDKGKIKRLPYIRFDGYHVKERLRKISSLGYVELFRNNKGYQYRASYLILITFKGPPKNKYGRKRGNSLARHLDDNDNNNNLNNLAWGSHVDNYADSIRNGIKRGAPKGKPLSIEHKIKISQSVTARWRMKNESVSL